MSKDPTLRELILATWAGFETDSAAQGFGSGTLLLMLPTERFEALLGWCVEQFADAGGVRCKTLFSTMIEQTPYDLLAVALRDEADTVLFRLMWSEFVVDPETSLLTVSESLRYK